MTWLARRACRRFLEHPHTHHPAAAAPPSSQGLVFAGYQGMFAVITPALMTGAFADRLRFGPYLVFIVVFIVFIYW